MKQQTPIEKLLRWRSTRAEDDAPPAPRAARLLEMSRPWWEVWPDHFREYVGRLGSIRIALGHAMVEPGNGQADCPIPVLMVAGTETHELVALPLYFSVREGRLLLRFRLEGGQQPKQDIEATLVDAESRSPIASGLATHSVDGEFSLGIKLAPQSARDWSRIKVVEPMPFRMILRAAAEGC